MDFEQILGNLLKKYEPEITRFVLEELRKGMTIGGKWRADGDLAVILVYQGERVVDPVPICSCIVESPPELKALTKKS